MNVQYTTEALAFLDQDHDDPTIGELVDAALDEFELDPTNVRWRAKAYGTVSPRVWAFRVRGRHDDVMVLWQQFTPVEPATPSDDRIFVSYIGPVL